MPTNPTVEYQLAEEEYRKARTIQEKIKALENMLAKAPKHKSSESLLAQIKQKLSKHRALLEKEKARGKGGQSLAIKKEGAASVVLVGIANSGKSLLLSKLTNAKPLVSEAEYATQVVQVGVMDCGGVKIQVLEIPSLYAGCLAKYSQFTGLIRIADLIVGVLDGARDIEEQLDLINSEIEKMQIRINVKRPLVKIRRGGSGGIGFVGENYLKANKEDAIALLRDYKIFNAVISLYEDTTLDMLSNAANESLVYLPCLFAVNKCDLVENFIVGKQFKDLNRLSSGAKEGQQTKGLRCPEFLEPQEYHKISALTGKGLDILRQEIWNSLNLIRVFTKTPGKQRDFPPLALKKGSSIGVLAGKIHKDLVKKFKFARVWGRSAQFEGQRVGLPHVLEEGDVVEVHV